MRQIPKLLGMILLLTLHLAPAASDRPASLTRHMMRGRERKKEKAPTHLPLALFEPSPEGGGREREERHCRFLEQAERESVNVAEFEPILTY